MAETTSAEVTTKGIAEFVDRWLAAWTSYQPERVLDLMTDDIVYDEASWPETLRGHADVREFLDWFWGGFPELTIERVGDPLISPDGSRAAFWWRATMTNSGPIDPPGIPPTGKRAEYEGADFHEYRDGKVARLQIVSDMLDINRQLGLLPARGSTTERLLVGLRILQGRLKRS